MDAPPPSSPRENQRLQFLELAALNEVCNSNNKNEVIECYSPDESHSHDPKFRHSSLVSSCKFMIWETFLLVSVLNSMQSPERIAFVIQSFDTPVYSVFMQV